MSQQNNSAVWGHGPVEQRKSIEESGDVSSFLLSQSQISMYGPGDVILTVLLN
jgi:hypothetical protein